MKISLIAYCLLNSFEAINALYPASIGQVNNYNTRDHQFQKRAAENEMKIFNITINCSSPQCKKVSDTFDKLTNTLSSFIQVKNQIKVEVNFESRCKKYKECDKIEKYSYGSYTESSISTIKNKEGLEIDYPYTLYKQLADPYELKLRLIYGDTDFTLNFNSDVKYWFEGDGNIEANQPNFFLIAAAELVRELGVHVSIVGYGDDGLVFFPSFTSTAADDNFQNIGSISFNRAIMDSLLVTTSDGKTFNNLLDPYINFKSGNISLTAKDLDSYLKKTPLIETSKKIEKLATTPDSLAIKLPSGKSLILETSAQPYDPIRSLRFISENKYLRTKEALLTSKVVYGEEPLPQGKVEDWPTYPFGPLLIETLEYMGYTLKDSYKNSSAYLNSEKEEDKSDNKSGTNGSNIFKANISLLFILLSLYLFN